MSNDSGKCLRAQHHLFKLLILSNQQLKTQRYFYKDIIHNKEKHKIITFQDMQTEDVLSFCLKHY